MTKIEKLIIQSVGLCAIFLAGCISGKAPWVAGLSVLIGCLIVRSAEEV